MNFTEQFVKAAFSREKAESVMVYFNGPHEPATFSKKFAFAEMAGHPAVQCITDMETGEILWPEE